MTYNFKYFKTKFITFRSTHFLTSTTLTLFQDFFLSVWGREVGGAAVSVWLDSKANG